MKVLFMEEYTKFEKARIIGARALQLAYGVPPLIKVPEHMIDPLELAEMEFEKGVIPITIIRHKRLEEE
jgi:DNA-directed RNA polymerase subunit K